MEPRPQPVINFVLQLGTDKLYYRSQNSQVLPCHTCTAEYTIFWIYDKTCQIPILHRLLLGITHVWVDWGSRTIWRDTGQVAVGQEDPQSQLLTLCTVKWHARILWVRELLELQPMCSWLHMRWLPGAMYSGGWVMCCWQHMCQWQLGASLGADELLGCTVGF